MSLDPNIILQAQAPKFDSPVDVAAKAMTMRQLANQVQVQNTQMAEDQAMKDAFRKNVTVGSDGNSTINRKAALADLVKVNPQKAIDYQKMFREQDVDELKKNTEAAKNLSWSVTDDGSNYGEIRTKAIQMGLPNAEKMPEQYMKSFVDNWKMHALSGEEQLSNHMKQQEFERKDRENSLKHEENMVKREGLMSDKNEKRLIALKDDLDPNKARGGNLAKSQAMINSADRVDGLFQQFPDYNIPKAQTVELATAVASLISGGSPQSQHQIDMMVPSSMRGSSQDIASWITNNPQGRDQVGFMKMMHETAARERQIAESQVKNAQIARLAAHKHLEKADPESYRAVLQSYGIDPSEVKNGKYSPAPKEQEQSSKSVPAQSHPEVNQAMEWAKANPNDPRAQAIRQRLGQ